MRQMFYPESVAVIGASASPNNMGKFIVANCLQFRYGGRLHMVSPRGGVLYGQRIHQTILDVPDEVDLAVIFTPVKFIPEVMRQCGEKGVRRAIIESSGFSEYGPERQGLEAEVLGIAREYGIRFVGPNGIGIINMENGLCVPFPRIPTTIHPGGLSIISQSGGVGLTYLFTLSYENIGINKFVSVGNKLDVQEAELLEFMIDDPGTEAVCLYLESVVDGRRLMELAGNTDKPIVIHKSNIGAGSAGIAQSHTAALLNDDAVVEAAFKQAGIIRTNDVAHTLAVLKSLTVPRPKGNRLAIISRSGGHAVVAADACDRMGMALPPFPQEVLDKIESHFRASVIKLQNPLDLGDLFDMNFYNFIVEEALKMEEIDGVVCVIVYRGQERKDARAFIHNAWELAEKYQKPLALGTLVRDDELKYLKENAKHPVFTTPEEGVRALASLYHAQKPQRPWVSPDLDVDRGRAEKIIERALSQGRDPAIEESFMILEAYGLSVCPWQRVEDIGGALAAAGELGYPVAVKISAADVSHKTEAGGVAVGLADEAALEAACQKMIRDLPDGGGLIVQPMIQGTWEVILGLKRDPSFGPVVAVGLGGIMVEVLHEVALRVAPLDGIEADKMIGDFRGAGVLDGFRGRPAVDKAALQDQLVRLSRLGVDLPVVAEVDLNPVMAMADGCRAVDARIVLAR
ncbi:MAG: acetate--CoA ligase family protein [Proteobacteria bacterium]|nr:acetate--CoA ligase family protein [Pseudomonadota bacterium]